VDAEADNSCTKPPYSSKSDSWILNSSRRICRETILIESFLTAGKMAAGRPDFGDASPFYHFFYIE